MDINQTVWYHIVNANTNSNRMLEVPDLGDLPSRLQDRVFIKQGDEYNSSDQSPWSLWHFVHIGDGKYHIFNKGSGRCMVMENGWTNDGACPWQYSVIGERRQEQWTITDVPDGSGNAYIQNVNSGLYLEIQNSGTQKGDICQQWDNNGQSGAQWQLKATTLTTLPKLTKASIDGNQIHAHDHTTTFAGSLTGENITIGSTVKVEKVPGIKPYKLWTGLVYGNYADGTLVRFSFNVHFDHGNPNPVHDDTITVTVTNTAQQSCPGIQPDPPVTYGGP